MPPGFVELLLIRDTAQAETASATASTSARVASLEAELANGRQQAATAAADAAKQLATKQAQADELAAALTAVRCQLAEQVRPTVQRFHLADHVYISCGCILSEGDNVVEQRQAKAMQILQLFVVPVGSVCSKT